jgi:hypothetical protein
MLSIARSLRDARAPIRGRKPPELKTKGLRA